MSRITDSSQLPSWLRQKEYAKNLDAMGWLREIRRRQLCLSNLEMAEYMASHGGDDSMSQTIEDFVVKWLQTEMNPRSPLLDIDYETKPVQDLSAGEAVYLGFSAKQRLDPEFVLSYERMLIDWLDVIEEEAEGSWGRSQSLGAYERTSWNEFANILGEEEGREEYDRPIDDIGNPLLSAGRALSGWPITVDTAHDDQSILAAFREWLKAARQKEKSSFRRPFNQNDFDDWQYYKLREVFDIDIWARVTGTQVLNRVVAAVLWPTPTDDFSPIDVLRTTSRKKAKSIFTLDTASRLFHQIRRENEEADAGD